MFLQESIQNLGQSGAFETVEPAINAAVQWLRLAVEAVGAIVIGIGVVLAIYQLLTHFRNEQSTNFNEVRLTLGKYLALALEFQVGADILSTAIAPSYEQIGKLGAIVVIRTLLNYFLTKELAGERRRVNQAANDGGETTKI